MWGHPCRWVLLVMIFWMVPREENSKKKLFDKKMMIDEMILQKLWLGGAGYQKCDVYVLWRRKRFGSSVRLVCVHTPDALAEALTQCPNQYRADTLEFASGWIRVSAGYIYTASSQSSMGGLRRQEITFC
jgi:hypothetical protein